ncbi:hypothetical protein F5Y10DRAFT_245934 [Nemania abortiva]|nr:hypothetical protein F5Y10DRAFT_245934 [Nemania abortiva]
MDLKNEPEENQAVSENLVVTHRRKVRLYSVDANRVVDIARHVWIGLLKRRSAYLTEKTLERLNIKCTQLDLSTGAPSDGSEIFIRPFPTARIHEILARTEPWHECKLLEKGFTRQSTAALILNCLVEWLTHNKGGTEKRLINYTDWHTRSMQYSEGERLYESEIRDGRGPDWSVEKVLDKMDGLTPHVSCLLADTAPLRDAQLSRAEMWCILRITYRRMKLREYRKHRIIPVTVISAADRRVRIVQGYFDSEEGCVRVRKSPILDFDQGDVGQKIILLLSWCIGDTVGHTKA